MDEKEYLKEDSIIILSPSHLFGNYAREALPEVRTNKIHYVTMEDLFNTYLGHEYKIRSGWSRLEFMLTSPYRKLIRETIYYKGDFKFVNLLDAFIKVYQKEGIKFETIYYGEEPLASKNELEEMFRNNPSCVPIGVKLKRMAYKLMGAFRSREEIRLRTINTKLDVKDKVKESAVREKLKADRKQTIAQIESMTTINYKKLYEAFLQDEKIPIEPSIRKYTLKALMEEKLNYEDGMVLLYMKVKLEGKALYKEVKRVIIEKEEYCNLEYSILHEIFNEAKYDALEAIDFKLQKGKNKASYEINTFIKRLIGEVRGDAACLRHEEAPLLSGHENEMQLLNWVKEKVLEYKEEGMKTICILCKTRKQVNHLYSKLWRKIDLIVPDTAYKNLKEGVFLLPIYMARGFKYDAVIVYETNQEMYDEEEDKTFLYSACMSAVHRLCLGYTQEISHFLEE